MDIFLESPWLIVALGTLMTVMLLAGLLKTGRAPLLWAVVGTVLLTGGLVALERYIVTTREEIAATLDNIADQLQRGAHEDVMRQIASDALALRREADRLLPQIEFHEVRVKHNLRLVVRDPRHLTATFNAVMVVAERNGAGDRHHVPSFFKVDFVREGDAWKVTRYERSDPRDGMKQEGPWNGFGCKKRKGGGATFPRIRAGQLVSGRRPHLQSFRRRLSRHRPFSPSLRQPPARQCLSSQRACSQSHRARRYILQLRAIVSFSLPFCYLARSIRP